MSRDFRLSTLLRLRRLGEDSARAELARARAAETAERRRRRGVREVLGEDTAEPTGPGTISAIAAARAAGANLLAELDVVIGERAADAARAEAALAEAAADAARAEAALAEAALQTRRLEKLEQRHRDAVIAEELAAEQSALDEIGGRRPASSSSTSSTGFGED
jgi:flagellar protein FliJ